MMVWNGSTVSKTEWSTQPGGTVANQDAESVNGQENPVDKPFNNNKIPY